MSTESPLVFVKDTNTSTFSADLSTLLVTGETVSTITVVTISPTTSPALTLGSVAVSSPTFSVPIAGGKEGTTYGVQLTVTTSLTRTFTVTLAVLIQTDLNVPYASRNPYAFQTLVGEIEAGDVAVGTGFFVLDPTADATTGYVTWTLLDGQGTVYAQGNCYDYRVTVNSMAVVVEAHGLVNVPSETPPTLDTQKYQVRWELFDSAGIPLQTASENVSVLGTATVPLGAEDTVEMHGDLAQAGIVVSQVWTNFGIEVYKGNILTVPYTVVQDKTRVSSGWYYKTNIDTSQLPPSLDPYVLSWKYSAITGGAMRETGRLYVVNASMLNAIEDVRGMVMKARTTLLGYPDAIFDNMTIMTWLRRAKDMFNASTGMITNFDMTDATGGVREYWMTFAEVAALRAQYLAEGEKSFNFQGQSISLDIDHTQYYQGLADTLQQKLDAEMPNFKRNLKILALTSGTGNMDGAGSQFGAMGCVGVGLNVISPNSGYGRQTW